MPSAVRVRLQGKQVKGYLEAPSQLQANNYTYWIPPPPPFDPAVPPAPPPPPGVVGINVRRRLPLPGASPQ
jgi:hypothetical protein